MKELRFAAFGAGFWAPYQLAAWAEQPGVRCAAVCDTDRRRAEALARRFGIPAYDDPQKLLNAERVDFVDVITGAAAHAPLVRLAAARGLPAVCQKPLAPSLAEARALAEECDRAGVPLLVHENWRWQAPLRALKRALDEGVGRVFRARLEYVNSFPVFANQPSLKELEQFVLADMGVHLLDVARFLFGEATSVYCQTARVAPDIRGEDVATVVLRTAGGACVVCAFSYASRVEHDRFPETYAFVEGTDGSAELAPDYWVRVTTAAGTLARRHPPPRYAWADPVYELAQASMVPCQADLLRALRGEGRAETDAADNLKTLALVYGAYESARTGQVVSV